MLIEQDPSFISTSIRSSCIEDQLYDRVLDLAIMSHQTIPWADLILIRQGATGDLNPVIAGELTHEQGWQFWVKFTAQSTSLKVYNADSISFFQKFSNRDGDYIDGIDYGKLSHIKRRKLWQSIRVNRHHRKRRIDFYKQWLLS